jgi:two-component system LytT family response regulator
MNPIDSQDRIRALIVDDEPAARRGLRLLLSRHEDVEIVGECGSAPEIGPALKSLAPDVVFLDVRMPGGTGIDALGHAPEGGRPLVVLVTAFEEHALEAFDVEAVDYLLKPFSDSAFERSLERVRRHVARIRTEEAGQWIAATLETARSERGTDSGDRLAIRRGERIHLVDPTTIRWVAAEGDYVRLHTSDGEYLLRETMQTMEARLSSSAFVRLHRSTLARTDAIREVRPRGRGRYVAILEDDSRRNISRRGQSRLERALGITL